MNVHSAWAVMSCFRPDRDAVANAVAALSQVDELIVVDDGSGEAYDDLFSELESTGARVVRSAENRGIAAALNAGYATAFAAGATHVVSLDQDSALPPMAVERLLAAFEHGSRVGDVGAVVPEYFADVRQAKDELAPGIWTARNIIQSGMLLPRGVFADLGVLREDFFIDLVDTEYELRLRSAGYRVLAAPGVRIDHRLGQHLERRFLGLRVRLPGIPTVVTVSTPFRYFYRVRNRIVLNRTYRGSHRGQLRRDTVLDVIHFVNVAALARPRRAFWRVLRAGYRAGRQRLMGPIPDAVMVDARQVTWAAPTATTAGMR